MKFRNGNARVPDGGDDASTTASAINTPPESVADGSFEEASARDRVGVKKAQRNNQEHAATECWFCFGLKEILKSCAVTLVILFFTVIAARYFDAEPNNTILFSDNVGFPVQTVTATVTAAAAATAQPLAPIIPGNVYMIRSISSLQPWTGSVITHLGNEVLLTTTKNRMSHWLVVEKKGWLGFMNVQSGLFLGHDRFGNLQCTATNHNGWEMFHFQPGGRRGQVLLMTHWDSLVPVGVSLYQGNAGLRKLVDSKADGMVWEFVKVGG